MLKKNAAILAVCVAVACLSSCATPLEDPSIEITEFRWISENIDPDFWASPLSDRTCFYNFWIKYTGSITINDIDYARVYTAAGPFWDVVFDPSYFTGDCIGGWGRWYNNSDGHTLPLGDVRAEVRLKNGQMKALFTTLTGPGGTDPSGTDAVYTENVVTPPASSIPALLRASIATHSITSNTATITFSVDDNYVYNGAVFFYDGGGNSVGTSPDFRDKTTGTLNSIINGGSDFHTGGSTNTLSISDSQVTFDNGKTFSDISQFVIFLSDGQQFGSGGKYNYCSVTARTPF